MRADDGRAEGDAHIPDDARELEPDRRAYYRELRYRRWMGRWAGPSGPVLLVAIFMVTLAATMMFTFLPRGAGGPAASPSPTPPEIPPDEAVGAVGAPLPNLRVQVGPGVDRLRDIENPAVLLLGTARCGCDDLIARMARRARHPHGVAVYSTGHAPVRPVPVVQVEDPEGALSRAYDARGLTAVLIGRDGLVRAVRTHVRDETTLEPLLSKLHT